MEENVAGGTLKMFTSEKCGGGGGFEIVLL